MESIYVNSKNQATIKCAGCGKSKTVDVSQFIKIDGPVKIKYKFVCDYCARKQKKGKTGHTRTVILERRQFYRKKVTLPGIFIDSHGKKGVIVVTDLSRSGLKFKLKSPWPFRLDDHISIEFHLDTPQKTLIKKKSIIKKIDPFLISAEFTSSHTYNESDKAIGFYLMG